MTILIIEDERRSATVLRELIGSIPGNHQVVGVVDSVDSSVTFLKAASPQPDLILLDVQLADGSGFEIFKRVRVQSAIVICSSTADHGAAGRAIGAVGYLLKPVDKALLTDLLNQQRDRAMLAR